MININDLYKRKEQRNQTREGIYKKVLEKCHNKIYHSSDKYISQEYTYFEIPNVLLGYPLFNKDECSKYIIQKLLKNGFTVKYLGSGLIFICWKKNLVKQPKKLTFNLEKNTYKTVSNKGFRSITDIPQCGYFS